LSVGAREDGSGGGRHPGDGEQAFNEQIIAGISIAGPTFRLHNAALPTVIAAVRNAAQLISQCLRDLD